MGRPMKYSFVVPIYGDGELADDFCQELQRVMQGYLAERLSGGGAPGPDVPKVLDLSKHLELLFVNDGSPNDSWRFLEAAAARYPFVRVLELSRNFGQHIAVTCGYHHASGDFVGMLNVDMEDPPAEIPKLLDEIQAKDLDFVLGLRGERHSPWHTRLSSYLFNLLLNKLTGYDTPLNAATLRVMNRRFLGNLDQALDAIDGSADEQGGCPDEHQQQAQDQRKDAPAFGLHMCFPSVSHRQTGPADTVIEPESGGVRHGEAPGPGPEFRARVPSVTRRGSLARVREGNTSGEFFVCLLSVCARPSWSRPLHSA